MACFRSRLSTASTASETFCYYLTCLVGTEPIPNHLASRALAAVDGVARIPCRQDDLVAAVVQGSLLSGPLASPSLWWRHAICMCAQQTTVPLNKNDTKKSPPVSDDFLMAIRPQRNNECISRAVQMDRRQLSPPSAIETIASGTFPQLG